jgi:hypothetical protein
MRTTLLRAQAGSALLKTTQKHWPHSIAVSASQINVSVFRMLRWCRELVDGHNVLKILVLCRTAVQMGFAVSSGDATRTKLNQAINEAIMIETRIHLPSRRRHVIRLLDK